MCRSSLFRELANMASQDPVVLDVQNNPRSQAHNNSVTVSCRLKIILFLWKKENLQSI
jgi:hypothetical protein